MTDNRSYLEQIEKYYNHTLKSFDLIYMGKTPEVLISFGASNIPLVMQQSTLTKCVRKRTGSRSAHELSRSIIETLPEQIANPIFLIEDKERGSLVTISDAKDKAENNILVAIKLAETKNAMNVNLIKSVYGKTNLKEYLIKHDKAGNLHIIDNQKAEKISRVIGLQLSKASILFGYEKKISYSGVNVNTKFSVHERLEKYKQEVNKNNVEQDVRQHDHGQEER